VTSTTSDSLTVIDLTDSDERRAVRPWTSSPRRLVPAFCAAFVASEAIGAFVSIPLQAVADAVMAFVAVNTAIFGYRTKRTAGLVMAALFTSRLVTLTLPATHIASTTRMGLIGVLTVLVAYSATWVLGVDITGGRSDEGYALRPPIVSRSFTAALTVLSGFPIGWLAYDALKPDRLLIQSSAGGTALPWAVVVASIAVAAIGEELLYRRLVAAMVQHTGQSQTPLFSALIYGSVFLGMHNLAMVGIMTLAGFFFAWSCERTGSIKPVVTAHIIASMLFYVVLPR
jgi:membrane protease YdiL (CAAX protease family)